MLSRHPTVAGEQQFTSNLQAVVVVVVFKYGTTHGNSCIYKLWLYSAAFLECCTSKAKLTQAKQAQIRAGDKRIFVCAGIEARNAFKKSFRKIKIILVLVSLVSLFNKIKGTFC